MPNWPQGIAAVDRRSILAAGVAMTAFAIGAPGVASGQSPNEVVSTRQGKLRGRRVGDVYEFLGVRYAEPQNAANRFKPPIPLEPWQGVRDALKVGPAAMQRWGPAGFMTAWAVQPEISEDCLTVNVYTPAINDGKKRPVMFWCHGGAFVSGSGSTVAYDGKNLAAFGDVVVVTVTHRLGVFGFLHLAHLTGGDFAAAGNAGLLDIVEALKWVRDNIAAFGGDPGSVTLFGQSGGGMKISTLMAMPAAAGLFHKAIVQSGPMVRVQTAQEGSQAAQRLLSSLSIAPADAAQLRSIPAEALLDAGNKIQTFYGPVVDGVHLPRHPFDPDAPAVSKTVPMLIGSTETETTISASEDDFRITDAELRERLVGAYGDRMVSVIETYKATYPGLSPSRLLFRFSSDLGVRAPSIFQAERKVAQGGAPAFMYLMAWGTPIQGGRLEARHTIDVGFAFHNHHNLLVQQYIGAGPVQNRLGDEISSAWVAFARTGDPSNPITGKWDAYNTATRPTMVFSTKTALVKDPHRNNRRAFMAMYSEGGPKPMSIAVPRGRGATRLPS